MQLKKYLCGILFLIISLSARAQQPNPCHSGWGEWAIVYSFAPGVHFKVAFNMLIKAKAGSFSCQESWYKFSNDYLKKGTYVEFKFNYRTLDGQVKTQNISIELNRTGLLFNSSGDFFNGYEIIGPIYDIKYVDPQRDKAKQLATDVNKSISGYDAKYNDALAQLAKIQDPQKKRPNYSKA